MFFIYLMNMERVREVGADYNDDGGAPHLEQGLHCDQLDTVQSW